MLNKPVPVDQLRIALRKRYPNADISVSLFDGGSTTTLLDVPELSGTRLGKVSITWGDGVDPVRVLAGRLIDAGVIKQEDMT